MQAIPDHPSSLLPRLSLLGGVAFEFEFSKYVYIPQSTRDDREYIRVKGVEAFAQQASLLGALNPDQELALHSRIFLASGVKHIPMLDLAGKFSDLHRDSIAALMKEFTIKEFAVFDSGRSAHVYGIGLLSAERQIQFFARALLLNLPGKPDLVDSRWIGHRIYAGYGSLRWSCNTKQYLSTPKAIGLFSAP
ncbi:MAG: primase 1D-like protein [Bdellovibrionota bacterium]